MATVNNPNDGSSEERSNPLTDMEEDMEELPSTSMRNEGKLSTLSSSVGM